MCSVSLLVVVSEVTVVSCAMLEMPKGTVVLCSVAVIGGWVMVKFICRSASSYVLENVCSMVMLVCSRSRFSVFGVAGFWMNLMYVLLIIMRMSRGIWFRNAMSLS